MKTQPNSLPMWNRLQTRIKILATLLLAGGLISAARAQVTFVPVFSNAWVVVAGTYPDLAADSANTVRGAAINPITTNVLYASRGASSNHVGIVSFANGNNYVASLNALTVSAGTLAEDGIRVSDDGTIYVCNLAGAPASRFLIFKYANETAGVSPTVVYDSGAGTSFQWRIGDYIDVRGSGASTEIVGVGSGGGVNITTNFVIFRPTDATCTTFTNFTITIPGGVNNLCGGGVAFEGANNALWIRRAGSQETRHIVYDPVLLTAVCDRTNNVDQSVCQGLKYLSYNGVNMLATVQTSTGNGSAQIARVFQIPSSPTAGLISVLSSNIPAVTGSVNGNGLGNVDSRDGYLLFGAPGHGLSFFKLGFVTNSPPSVTASQSGSTFVAGYNLNAAFTGNASGSTPLSYQWFFNNGVTTNLINGAITNAYTVTNVQVANAGSYFVVVTNLYGKATSSVVSITVLPNGGSMLASNLWSVAPGSRPYLTTGDTQRGIGFDTNLNRVVVVTRAPTNGILLLDGNTGADVGNLDISALLAITPPGTFPINMCGVGDDGVVYVANLITSADADTFAIYSWGSADPSATINQAYVGNPLQGISAGSLGRLGDTMAVRGAGTNTEILCTFRNGTNVCIFTTTDGVNFTPNIIGITNLAASIGTTDPFTGASPLGLGCAFGAGNTFWAKSTAYNLRQITFDLSSGYGAVVGSYAMPTSVAPLGLDVANGYIGLVGVTENPMNLSLYDITTPNGPTINTIVDREIFGANNANGNGTGSVVFDVAGGRIFSLSSNSGLLALTYAPRLYLTKQGNGVALNWTGPGTLQSAIDVRGPYNNVLTTSPYTNTAASQIYFRVKR
jgi:hypothetical protein